MDTITMLQLVSVLVSDLVCPVLIAGALCVGVYFQVRKYYEDKACAEKYEAMWGTHDTCDLGYTPWEQMKEEKHVAAKSSRKRK